MHRGSLKVVGASMTCYTPSRRYLSAGFLALCLAAFSAWCAEEWTPALIPAILLLLSSAAVLFLALQPRIKIHEEYLAIGKRVIPWSDILRLDRTSWVSPLVMNITLTGEQKVVLIYPGDFDSATSLLRHLRRSAKDALIDGIPYRQFWGESFPSENGRGVLPAPRYHLLPPEDEAEVERLYQRLKAVGHLDPKTDDK